MTASSAVSDRRTSDAAAWAAVGALVIGVAAFQWRSPIPVEAKSLQVLAVTCAALSGAALFYRRIRRQENFAVMCIALMQVLLFSALGSILSYFLAREGGALWDGRLAGWDRAIGFDWLAFVNAVDAHRWLALPLRWAYMSLVPQIIVLVLVLGFTRRVAELRAVMLAAILCGTAAILLSPIFPAVGNYVHLGLTADDFRHVDPWAGNAHLDHFTALRDGTMTLLRLQHMEGIITFPSYHAGLAAITLFGFWSSGIAWLRWPGAAVALATIVATPVDGGHYLVDVLAGIAIAIPSIAAARRAIGWQPSAEMLRAWPFRRSRAASAP